MIQKYVFLSLVVVALSVGCYLLGRSHAEVKIVKERGEEIIKEVEVVKYVEKQKSDIWAAPNADSNELIGLFMQDKL